MGSEMCIRDSHGTVCHVAVVAYLTAGGMDSSEALQTAIASSLAMFGVTLTFLTLAWKHLPKDEASRLDRARALGEEIVEAKG